jgi:predicted nucleotidyltransferase
VTDLLQTTLLDAVRWLESRGVHYALIGGLATSLRGQIRVTADVDLVIATDLDTALGLVDDLPNTPFAPLFDNVTDVVQRAFILPLRHRVTGVKVDVAIGLSGFEQLAVSRAEPIELYNYLVATATTEDLIIMKALAGRPQDDQDLRGMLLVQRDRIDWEYCLQMAAELSEAIGQDLSERLLRFKNESP